MYMYMYMYIYDSQMWFVNLLSIEYSCRTVLSDQDLECCHLKVFLVAFINSNYMFDVLGLIFCNVN